MQAPIRIVMADDHELFCDGFAVMLRNIKDIELVDQAPNGTILVQQVTKHHPDVVLTDITMDNMDGIEATKIIKHRFPEIPVIALTMHEDNLNIMAMLTAGATGYVVKNSAKETVVDAIRAAYKGENFYCRQTSQQLSALIASGRFDPKNPSLVGFTPTEIRIIQLMCSDKEYKQIAEELKISVKSVSQYKLQIMKKAEVNSTAGLIVFAIRTGIYKA